MAFTGDGRKLTGNDGLVYKATIGVEVVGNAVLAMPVGLHLVTAVAAATGFPAKTTGTIIEVGRLIRVRTGQTITPAVGDKFKTLTLATLCDITSFTMPFTAAEIDTTTFCDDIMTYEVGKVDMQGTMDGITTIGTTTDNGGLLNRFIDIIKQDGITSYDVYQSSAEVYFGYFVVNKTAAKGDELAVFAPVNLFGASLGGAMGDAQGFSSNFRFASYDGILPALYRFAL